LCGLKQAENELNTTHFSEQGLSLAENLRIQKQAFSASFQTENDPFKNPSTGFVLTNPSWDWEWVNYSWPGRVW